MGDKKNIFTHFYSLEYAPPHKLKKVWILFPVSIQTFFSYTGHFFEKRYRLFSKSIQRFSASVQCYAEAIIMRCFDWVLRPVRTIF